MTSLAGQESNADEELAHLSWFSRHYIISVMLDLAPSVTGTSRSISGFSGRDHRCGAKSSEECQLEEMGSPALRGPGPYRFRG